MPFEADCGPKCDVESTVDDSWSFDGGGSETDDDCTAHIMFRGALYGVRPEGMAMKNSLSDFLRSG